MPPAFDLRTATDISFLPVFERRVFNAIDAAKMLGSEYAVIHPNTITVPLPTLKGRIDWRDAMKGLSDIGFDGLFNYEIKTGRVPSALRDSFSDYLVRSAEEILSYL